MEVLVEGTTTSPRRTISETHRNLMFEQAYSVLHQLTDEMVLYLVDPF
jgi:hypothetical protein